jgi:hypothetical protein
MIYKNQLFFGFRNVFIFLVIFSETFFISCDKKGDIANDYRSKYIGEYQVKKTISCYGPCWTCSSENDTVIKVIYGLTDSTLNVLGREICLDSDGNYFDYHYELKIKNDSIYSNFMNGGLGCGKYEIYKGYRISNKL